MHTDLTMPMFAGWWIAVTFDVRGDLVVIGRLGGGGGLFIMLYFSSQMSLPEQLATLYVLISSCPFCQVGEQW